MEKVVEFYLGNLKVFTSTLDDKPEQYQEDDILSIKKMLANDISNKRHNKYYVPGLTYEGITHEIK